MYFPNASTYTHPVTDYPSLCENLRPYLPETDVAPPPHILTIKTCNANYLLARGLGSIRYRVEDAPDVVVIDDSTDIDARKENRIIAQDMGAEYYATKGKYSIVAPFAEFIAQTEAPEVAEPLLAYLNRIVTDYPREPSQEAWGGVAGAQNIGHLVNVMNFGERGVPREQWLSTFIDDDVLMPEKAEDIFRMIRLYHALGNVGVIASNYLHHSGNPVALARRAIKWLVAHEQTLGDDELRDEMDAIFSRTPSVGLRTPEDSDEDYGSPALTMIFPGGNYSLSGSRAFDIPVPVVGIEDVGFETMLQLFIGARNLGVARVPDFPHIRYKRPNGGSAYGSLNEFVNMQEKDLHHFDFQAAVKAYAAEVEQVPEQNLTDLRMRQHVARMRQLRQQRALVACIGDLLGRPRFEPYAEQLRAIKTGIVNLAGAKAKEVQTGAVDTSYSEELIRQMRTLHPVLVQKAYEFGASGALAAYREMVRRSTPRV